MKEEFDFSAPSAEFAAIKVKEAKPEAAPAYRKKDFFDALDEDATKGKAAGVPTDDKPFSYSERRKQDSETFGRARAPRGGQRRNK